VSHELSCQELDTVYGWIAQESYWARGLPRAIFDRSVAHSLCFALRDAQGRLRGFAPIISDRATFAYLCVVFIDPAVRGRGAGKALIEAVVGHPALPNLRRWMLPTRDAHELYARYGFTPLPEPERLMTRQDPDLYARMGQGQ
jgi:GNAT superfamily N-acetyltransferase